MGAELNVELRLLLDKVAGDAKAAAQEASKEFEKNTPKSWGLFDAWGKSILKFGKDTDKALDWWTKGVRKASIDAAKLSTPINKALEDWKKLNAGGIVPGMKITGVGDEMKKVAESVSQITESISSTGGVLATAVPNLDVDPEVERERQIKRDADLARIDDAKKAYALRMEQDKLKFTKDMSLLMLPLTRPSSIWATAFSSRAIATGLLGTETGRAQMARFGLSGESGARIATAVLVGGATTAGAALIGIKKAGQMVIDSFRVISKQYTEGAKLYSLALKSGYGMQMTTKRFALSEILGVSETELFKFSYAIGTLGEKTKQAVNAIANSTPQLTKVEQERRVQAINERAFEAERARTFSGLAFLNAQGKAEQASENLYYRKKLNDFLEKIGLLAPRALSPLQQMNQMPASTWEKMGLVIGSQGGNYQQQIANNTKQTNTLLSRLLERSSSNDEYLPYMSQASASMP